MAFQENVYRFLDTKGNGNGESNGVGDYSVTPSEFYVTPGGGGKMVISRMIVHIEDVGSVDAGRYGNNINLVKGIRVLIKRGDRVLTDFTGVDHQIKKNADWGKFCYDVQRVDWGAGTNSVQVRWSFTKSGQPIELIGGLDDRFCVVLNDNFTGLVNHSFNVQGWLA